MHQVQRKRRRTKFTPHQLNVLETFYIHATWFNKKDYINLGEKTGLSSEVVKSWLNNRRRKDIVRGVRQPLREWKSGEPKSTPNTNSKTEVEVTEDANQITRLAPLQIASKFNPVTEHLEINWNIAALKPLTSQSRSEIEDELDEVISEDVAHALFGKVSLRQQVNGQQFFSENFECKRKQNISDGDLFLPRCTEPTKGEAITNNCANKPSNVASLITDQSVIEATTSDGNLWSTAFLEEAINDLFSDSNQRKEVSSDQVFSEYHLNAQERNLSDEGVKQNETPRAKHEEISSDVTSCFPNRREAQTSGIDGGSYEAGPLLKEAIQRQDGDSAQSMTMEFPSGTSQKRVQKKHHSDYLKRKGIFNCLKNSTNTESRYMHLGLQIYKELQSVSSDDDLISKFLQEEIVIEQKVEQLLNDAVAEYYSTVPSNVDVSIVFTGDVDAIIDEAFRDFNEKGKFNYAESAEILTDKHNVEISAKQKEFLTPVDIESKAITNQSEDIVDQNDTVVGQSEAFVNKSEEPNINLSESIQLEDLRLLLIDILEPSVDDKGLPQDCFTKNLREDGSCKNSSKISEIGKEIHTKPGHMIPSNEENFPLSVFQHQNRNESTAAKMAQLQLNSTYCPAQNSVYSNWNELNYQKCWKESSSISSQSIKMQSSLTSSLEKHGNSITYPLYSDYCRQWYHEHGPRTSSDIGSINVQRSYRNASAWNISTDSNRIWEQKRPCPTTASYAEGNQYRLPYYYETPSSSFYRYSGLSYDNFLTLASDVERYGPYTSYNEVQSSQGRNSGAYLAYFSNYGHIQRNAANYAIPVNINGQYRNMQNEKYGTGSNEVTNYYFNGYQYNEQFR